jgi:hypothetical protein
MKKLFFAAICLTGLTLSAKPHVVFDSNHNILIQEKQYKKIQVSEISVEATDKIKKGYGQYTIKEAYRADDGEYKLVLSKDGVDVTATFTSGGDLIKILS